MAPDATTAAEFVPASRSRAQEKADEKADEVADLERKT